MLKHTLLIATLLHAAPALADGCKWVDGVDPAAPPNDAGRGISDWNAHNQWAQTPDRGKLAGELISGRMTTLKACGDKAAYARVYADVSVLIAHYGRASAGWKDAVDPAAPKDDPGRGIGSWKAHQGHVLQGVGMENAHALVAARVEALAQALPKPMFARLYADLSILLANLARSAS